MDILNYENFYKSKLLVEQHFHGAFGVDFSTCSSDEILLLAKKLLTHGIGGFYPTLVTDSVENIKRQIERIKTAQSLQTPEMAKILGIHLEGIFINPEKKGIHEKYSGFATNTNSKFLNSGIGVDDKGAATYPYYSFYNTNKKNNCYVIIEIEVNTKKKLTFFDGCDKSVLFNSPFKSIGILKLQ